MKKPDIWANSVEGLRGLHSDTPIRCIWHKNLKMYFSHNSDFCCGGIGEIKEWETVRFASKSKQDVQLWTNGVSAALSVKRQSAKQRRIV